MVYDKETIARVMREAQYIISNKCTIRNVAKAFGIPKTTVHRDLAEKLPEINWSLYMKVRKILNQNRDRTLYGHGKIVTNHKAG